MPRFAATVVLAVLTIVVVVFLALPQWRQVDKSRAAIASLRLLHEELQGLAANRDAIISQYNSIPDADLSKLSGIAPSASRMTDMLVALEELTRRGSLTLGQLDFSGSPVSTSALAVPSARRYEALHVAIALRGSYENFRDFLKALEHELRLFDTDEINFAVSGKEASINLKGRIYYRR